MTSWSTQLQSNISLEWTDLMYTEYTRDHYGNSSPFDLNYLQLPAVPWTVHEIAYYYWVTTKNHNNEEVS